MTEKTFWIWSNEHSAWSGRRYRSYVRTLDEAGTYTAEETADIIAGANITQDDLTWFKRNEVAFPAVGTVTGRACWQCHRTDTPRVQASKTIGDAAEECEDFLACAVAQNKAKQATDG